jgi:hypothetical protein
MTKAQRRKVIEDRAKWARDVACSLYNHWDDNARAAIAIDLMRQDESAAKTSRVEKAEA